MPVINNFPVLISTEPNLMIAPSSCIIIGGTLLASDATNTDELSEVTSDVSSLDIEQEV